MSKWTLVVAAAAGPVLAQSGGGIAQSLGVGVYPEKGQSAAKMQSDEGECYAWAKNQTGIDPMALASAQPQQPTTGPGRGAGRGAAAGAAIGGMAGNAGKGAAAGATAGAIRGGRQQRAQEQEQQAQAQVGSQERQAFTRSFSACLAGRGYSTK